MSDHDKDFRERLAKELDVPDGGQYLNDFLTRIDALKKRAAEADALEDENDKLVDVVGKLQDENARLLDGARQDAYIVQLQDLTAKLQERVEELETVGRDLLREGFGNTRGSISAQKRFVEALTEDES